MKLRKIFGLLLVLAGLQVTAGHVRVEVDAACADLGTVVAVDKDFAVGAAVSLKATPAKGAVFAGWYVEGSEAELTSDYRNATATFMATRNDVVLTAAFTTPVEDHLFFDFSEALSDFEANVELSDPIDLIVDSVSFPTVALKGLPAGLKFDAKTLKITGKPTKPGVYSVTATAKNASGYQYSQIFEVTIWNLCGDRTQSIEVTDAVVGDEIEESLDGFFYYESNQDGTLPSMTVSGWPTGLRYDAKTQMVTGKPTKAGLFVVTATMTYKTDSEGNPKSTKETASLFYYVKDEFISDYATDADLSGLEDLMVGDVYEAGEIGLGSYDSATKTGITKISGLPTGLSVQTDIQADEVVDPETGATNEVAHTVYSVVGMPTKAGLYTVSVTVAYQDDEVDKILTRVFTQPVVVAAAESFYLSAVPVPDESGVAVGGTVTGGGVMQPGTKVTLRATAAKGYVFAGWQDADENPISAGGDNRVPTQTFTAGNIDTTLVDWQALFVTTAEDSEVAFDGLDGMEYPGIDATVEGFRETFAVASASLPTLTVKGLPPGFSLTAAEEGGYEIVYDPEMVKKYPAPGVYPVTVKAVNVSKATAEASFTITVNNWTSPYINVPDDLGEWKPGDAIEPIPLTNAVAFAQGATLAVSGLPKGLVFNAKADPKKGVDANTITGTPTVPGVYTVTFTAKIPQVTTNAAGKVSTSSLTAQATSFLTVAPFPILTVDVDLNASEAGCKVSGAGGYIKDSKVALKATAAPGYVFAGWEGIGDEVSLLQTLTPSLNYVMGSDDTSITASFITLAEDGLYVDDFAETLVLPLKESVTNATVILDLVQTRSLPTLSVANLPAGLKFDAKTCLLSGAPTKEGVFYVTVTAKNAGGYQFVRVLRMVVGPEDVEDAPELDEAEIDLIMLEDITTGVYYPTDVLEADALVVDVWPVGDAETVTKIDVKGVPAGLSVTSLIEDGYGTLLFSGVPTKPGRTTVTVTVTGTYVDENDRTKTVTAKTVKTITVQDGGSQYVSVSSDAPSLGTVTGSGVYAAGATVKLTAKPAAKQVFTGWFMDGSPFAVPVDVMGIDYRTAAIAFPLINDLVFGEVLGTFRAVVDDTVADLVFDEGCQYGDAVVWELFDLDSSEDFPFAVDSASLPKLTVTGLPKGISFAPAVRLGEATNSAGVALLEGALVYDSIARKTIVPGVYTVKMSAVNQSKAADAAVMTLIVPNKVCDVIDTNPAVDAYPLTVGVGIGEILDSVALSDTDNYTLSVAGLPSGIGFRNGVFTGVPTKAGNYTVTLTAKPTTVAAKEGYETEVATITLMVADVTPEVVGTFNGFLYVEGREEAAGTLIFTAAKTGALSAKVMTASGTVRFTAKNWVSAEGGVYVASMVATGGQTLQISVDSAVAWTNAATATLTGTYVSEKDGPCVVQGRRPDWVSDTTFADLLEPLIGTYALTAVDVEGEEGQSWTLVSDVVGSLKVAVDKNGLAKLSGKVGTMVVSASSVLTLREDGLVRAEFVVVLQGRPLYLEIVFGSEVGGRCSFGTIVE